MISIVTQLVFIQSRFIWPTQYHHHHHHHYHHYRSITHENALIIGNIFSWFKLWKMLIQRMCPSLFSNYPKGNIRTLVWKFTLSFELKLKELLEIRTFPDSWGEDANFFFFFFFQKLLFLYLFIYLGKKLFLEAFQSKSWQGKCVRSR